MKIKMKSKIEKTLSPPFVNLTEMAQCCKANFKINSLRLETKKGKLCSHSFKHINCKGQHQVDSNRYLFWKHRFNRVQHAEKSQGLREIKANLIHSFVSRVKQ